MLRYRKMAPACVLFLALTLAGVTSGQTVSAGSAHPLTVLITVSAELTPGDLRVFIDKQPAQVLSLRSAEPDKLLFVLLVDASTSQAPYADAICHAATRIFQDLSAQGGVGYFGTFTDSLRLYDPPQSATNVQKLLDRTPFFGGTSLYDAVAAASSQLATQPHPEFPRRAIILLSDGSDDHSQLTLEKLLNAVEPAGTPIFSLVTPKSDSHGKRALKLMSGLTGGEAILTDNLDAGVAPLLSALDRQWDLTVAAPAAQGSALHSLSVKTIQKHLHISAPDQITLP